MTKWEYYSYGDTNMEEFDKELNNLGLEGWEVINVFIDSEDFYIAYFKRMITQ